MPTSRSSSFSLSFPGFPTPWSFDGSAVAGRLAEIGCDVVRKYVDRNLNYLKSLSEVREPTEFVAGYQAFLKMLWEDQAEALRAAGQVLREGMAATPQKASGQAAAKVKPAAKPAPGKPGTVRKVASSTTSKPAAVSKPATASKPVATSKPATAGKPAAPSKPTAAASKTAAPAPVAAMFELYQDDSGAHRFHLKAADGGVLLTSQGYKSRASALNGIEAVRRNAPVEARYLVPDEDKGKPRFNLRAANNQVIATSAEFPSAAEREAAMATVRSAAKSARVV